MANQNKIQGAAARWGTAMASPATAQAYKDGIQGVTENPMAKAAAQDQLFLQKVTESVTSGRRAAALNAVPMSVWQNQAMTAGAAALAAGARKGQSKVAAHFQKFGPAYIQASQAAAAIPNDGTVATALAKVAAAITVLKQAAGKPV